MCGIVGLISDQSDKYINEAIDLMNHRGPDGWGSFILGKLALGHKRLAIQDLSETGHQPMHSSDGNYTIVFNGEIYNHLDIRREIENKYPFRSSGDTETLLYGFIEYGEAVLKKLNGIFAFAIFNHASGELFIARDQFGIKPLYYYFKEKDFYFGSEIKSFLALPQFDKEINYKSIPNYLTLLWSPGETTPFSYVKKLLPGHFMKLYTGSPEEFVISKYYDIPFNGQVYNYSEEKLTNLLEEKLLKAVDRQLLADVPVGFFLSGGLDSSAIVAMAKKLRPNERLRCYTIKSNADFEEEGMADDLKYARQLAAEWDLDLVEVAAETDIIADFDKMIYHLDEPQADMAPLNVLNICKQAKADGYKVLLGGTAGDDIFTGYRRHQAINMEKYIALMPAFALKAVKVGVGLLKADSVRNRRLKKLVENIDKNKTDRLYAYFEWLKYADVEQLFSKETREKIKGYHPKQYFYSLLENISGEKSDINKCLYWELKTFLVDHNLNYTDKLSMATGIEVRVPFLDLELVEFSTLIPTHLKMKGKTTKYILKKVMERYMPNDVIYRSKVGFGAPLRKWITVDLADMVSDYLSEETINKRGYFDFETINTLVSRNKKGEIDASYTILSLMAFESWNRQFIDN